MNNQEIANKILIGILLFIMIFPTIGVYLTNRNRKKRRDERKNTKDSN